MDRTDQASHHLSPRLPKPFRGRAPAEAMLPLTVPIEQFHDAVIAADSSGVVTRWNRGAEELYGFGAEEIVGKHLGLLYQKEYRELLEQEAINRLEEQYRCEMELPIERDRGEPRWVHLSLSLVRGANGTSAGIFGYSIDITERKRAAEALRLSEERFQLAAEAVDALIYDYDLRTEIVFRSQGLLAILGFAPDEVEPSPSWWGERIHPDDSPRVMAHLRSFLAGESLYNLEYRMLHRRGHYVHVWDRALLLRDAQEQATRMIGCSVNVTDRKRAEEALRESEERHRLLAELTSDYTYTCRVNADGTTCLDSASPGFTRVTGYTLEEVSQPGGWASFIHPLDLAKLAQRMPSLMKGKPSEDEVRIRTKQGETRWVRYSIHPVWDEARRRIVRFYGASQDITDRRHAEEQVHDYAQRLQSLSRRLLEVQEQERRHLARELHDEVAQALTALNLALEMSTRFKGEPLLAALNEAQTQVKELTARVRDLSLRLRPTMLDDLGLVPALVWHFRRYTEQMRIQVDFQHRDVGRRFPHEVETAAYRIIQEALTNVARHASVDAVTVRFWLDREHLCLLVEDRGVGFDPETVFSTHRTSGLSGMQERAVLLGGRLTVESVRGAGTCVTAELPISESTLPGPASSDSLRPEKRAESS